MKSFDLYSDIIEIYREIDLLCSFKNNKVYQMINGWGTQRAAKELIRNLSCREEIYKLIELERLDLAIETIVLSSKYSEEFSTEDKDIAKKNLQMFKGTVENKIEDE